MPEAAPVGVAVDSRVCYDLKVNHAQVAKGGRWIWVAGWIMAILMRLPYPLSDPPADLSWSGGYFADEGFWTHDARNLTLFGAFSDDEWHDRFVSPLVYLLVRGLFRFAGPGLGTARIWAHVLSYLGLFFFMLICRSYAWGSYAFVAAAACSILAAYQRIAILETAVVFACIAALFFWLRSLDGDIPAGVSAGVMAASVFVIKGIQAFFLGAPILAFLLIRSSGRARRRSVIAYSAGMTAALTAWYILVHHPHADMLRQYRAYYLSQQGSGFYRILKNMVTQPFPLYFNRMPFIFPAAWAALARLVSRSERSAPPVITFSALWFILGLGALAVMGYRPVRYYIPLTIPMICLSVWWFYVEFLTGADGSKGFNHRVSPLFIGWMAIPPAVNILFAADRVWLHGRLTGLPPGDLPGFSFAGACLTVFVATGLVLWAGPFRRRFPLAPAAWSLIFFCFIGLHVVRTVNWFLHRSYTVRDASGYLAEHLPPGSVVAGQWAPELCLNTTFRAVPLWKGFVNGEDPFRRFGITHILSWKYPLGDELALQREWFPAEMQRARKIHEFRIKDTPVLLWEIDPVDRAR